MDNSKQPRNVFEQILLGQQMINDNIIALSQNLLELYNSINSSIVPISETDELNTPSASEHSIIIGGE